MIEFGSVILYLSLFVISSFLISIPGKKKTTSLLVIVALSIPILLAIFRHGVGTDYFNYFRNYIEAKNTTVTQHIENNFIEELFRFLVLKVGAILNSYYVVLGIYSALSIILIYFAIKNENNKLYIGASFFVYLCIYYPSSLNLMSQFVAVSLIALSFKYIFRGNIIKYTTIVFIASLFHTTALIAFPIYFLWNKRDRNLIGNWKIFAVILLCILITINYQVILDYISQINSFSEYGMYVAENNRGENRDLIVKITLFIIPYIFRRKLIKYDSRNKLYILLLLFNVILGFTGYSSPWVKRASLYFEVVQLFMIPSIIQIFRDRKDKIIIYSGILLYAIFYFILVYYILGNSHVIPYNLSL